MHFVCFVTVKFFFFHQRTPLKVAIERKRQDIAQFLTDVSAIKKTIPLAVILVLLI